MLTRGRQRIALTVLLTFLASSVAFGEDSYISGVGVERCSELNSRAKPGSRLQESSHYRLVLSWAQGFVSSFNMSGIVEASKAGTGRSYMDLSSISLEEQWAFITQYDRQNPSKQIVDAVFDLANGFQRRPVR
jgi:hypothetical protein